MSSQLLIIICSLCCINASFSNESIIGVTFDSSLLILFLCINLAVCACCVFDMETIEYILQRYKKGRISKNNNASSRVDIESEFCVKYNSKNPNENIDSVMKIFSDFKPIRKNKDKYFSEFIVKNEQSVDDTDNRVSINRIAAIVPFYN
eukprot:109477_1